MVEPADVRALLGPFGLGPGVLSPTPVALGRMGAVWRLDVEGGSWAVKTNTNGDTEAAAGPSAGFHEAAVATGVPAPALRRTGDGNVLARAGDLTVRVLEWVDLEPADPSLDPALVGGLLAALHHVPDGPWSADMPRTVHPWFSVPVGEKGWDDLIGEARRGGAPFAEDLREHRHELAALDALVEPPTDLRVCHRDVFADNVRRRLGGGICVFDFDNAGPQDPDHELAFALLEFATDARGAVESWRARALLDAYADAGGPGRLRGPGSFSMAIAVLGHLGEYAATQWLAAGDDPTRADLAGWLGELTSRPLSRAVVAELLDVAR